MNTIALIRIWNHTQQHSGTSGARVCAAVLLGLYNGARFPMDITDLRILDAGLLNDCLAVITADSVRCQKEVHEWLNCISGRYDFGQRFEALAWEYKCFAKGRAKDGKHFDFEPRRLAVEEPSAIRGKECTSMIVDEVLELSPTASRIYDMDAPRGMGAKRHAEMLARNSGVGKLGAPLVDMERRRDIGDVTPFFNDLAG